MKSAYLSGRQIAKIILTEAINGDTRYGRYIYRLRTSADVTQKAMEELSKHNFTNAGQLKKYLETYVIF